MTEEEQIEAAIEGDHAAFESLMRTYAPVVAAYLYGKIHSPEDREDLIQEVFVRAYTRLSKLRKRDRLGPWLLSIARNVSHDAYRRQASSKRAGVTMALDDYSMVADVKDRAVGPAGEVQYADIERQLRDAIVRQGDRYREVLYLSIFEERTSIEIAKLLGLKDSTVRMRIKKGREAIRRALGEGQSIDAERSTWTTFEKDGQSE